jgi:DNA-binding NarL/FixJ family response regulator
MSATRSFVASPVAAPRSPGGGGDSRLDSWLARMGVTRQEQRVVHLVERGLTNPEIAALLGVSRHTIRNQVASVFSKLQVSRRAELVYVLACVLGGGV